MYSPHRFVNTLRIATRKSPLAICQAEEVAGRLRALHPALEIKLVRMTTQGDRVLDSPLAKLGGKGLFVKELEQGLLNCAAEIAVHSMKDVPVIVPPGLHVFVVLEREDARDAFVSGSHTSLETLPGNARVGTSSLRRQCQLRARYPTLDIRDLRGNVNTRLARLDSGEYDALILASAGLKRLGLTERITAPIPPRACLPAIGQGAIGIECREDATHIHDLIEPLNHLETFARVRAERAINVRLGGGCEVPVAGYAEIVGEQMRVTGLVGYPDGSSLIRSESSGAVEAAEELGFQVAEDLLSKGANDILRAVGVDDPSR